MKTKKTIPKLLFASLLLFSIINGGLFQTQSVSAIDATEACRAYTTTGARAACEQGFNGGNINCDVAHPQTIGPMTNNSACNAGKQAKATDTPAVLAQADGPATEQGSEECNGISTSIIPCEGKGTEAIMNMLKFFLRILTTLVGIVAVGGIIYGGIQYTIARDNSEKTKEAIKMILNVVYGLVAFAFMVAILNFLIPGGIFG